MDLSAFSSEDYKLFGLLALMVVIAIGCMWWMFLLLLWHFRGDPVRVHPPTNNVAQGVDRETKVASLRPVLN